MSAEISKEPNNRRSTSWSGLFEEALKTARRHLPEQNQEPLLRLLRDTKKGDRSDSSVGFNGGGVKYLS